MDQDGLRPLTVKEWFQANFYATAIFLSWLTGLGPRTFNFGSDSAATKILTASNAFEEAKFYHDLSNRCKEVDPTHKSTPFHGRNANSFMEMLGNPLWAVTGKFTIDFLESGGVKMNIVILQTNTSAPDIHKWHPPEI